MLPVRKAEPIKRTESVGLLPTLVAKREVLPKPPVDPFPITLNLPQIKAKALEAEAALEAHYEHQRQVLDAETSP